MSPPNPGKFLPRPTKEYHDKPYAAISPSRPELSVKGKTVMITGGATGIGLATTKAFAEAGASLIVLLARSGGPMSKAKATVESDFPDTKVLTYSVSITDLNRVNEVVKEIGTIDILVLNAASMHKGGPVLDIDPKEVLNDLHVNVLGQLNLMSAFVKLAPRKAGSERTIINTSTAGITVARPGTAVYNATKGALTYIMRHVHVEHEKDGIRVFSFHPAIAFTDMARTQLGLTEDAFSYDSPEVPAGFAVWLCSAEADFLKGRFVYAQWDVDELKAKEEIIASDPSQLTVGFIMDKLIEQ